MPSHAHYFILNDAHEPVEVTLDDDQQSGRSANLSRQLPANPKERAGSNA